MKIQKIYPLSPMQMGMLFHSLKDEYLHPYIEQTMFSIKGILHVPILEQSFNIIINRHDVLKTVFFYEKLDKIVQVVLKERKASLNYKNISHLSAEEKTSFIDNFKKENVEKGFDLSNDLLIRISLLEVGINDYLLIWEFHHIIMDGWCLKAIFDEFILIYHSIINKTTLDLSPSTPYDKYINWIQKQDKDEGLNFWKDYLKDYEQLTLLDSFQHQNTNNNYKLNEYEFVIDKTLTDQLYNISKNNNITVSTIINAIWGIILQKYNNTDDVVFGVVVSGRSPEIEGIDTMMGLCINTVPVRVKTWAGQSIIELLNEMQHFSTLAKSYEYLFLSELLSYSGFKSDSIDHVVIFQNIPLVNNFNENIKKEVNIFEINEYPKPAQTNYDLWFRIFPGQELKFIIKYNENRFDSFHIESIAKQIQKVTKLFCKDVNVKIDDLDMIPDEEKKQLLLDFNNTKVFYPKNINILDLLDLQVARNTKRKAVVFEEQSISYSELDLLSNNLANEILKRKKEGEIVAISLKPSLEMIVGIIGIIKAGFGFLPLDESFPKERVEFILKDSDCSLLLTQNQQINPIDFSGDIIHLDNDLNNSQNIKCKKSVEPDKILYAIYTSGSTGKPKGVKISHANLINYNNWFSSIIEPQKEDKYLITTSFAFDAIYTQLFASLLSGGELHVLPREVYLSTELLLKYISDNEISILKMTPSLFNLVINSESFNGDSFKSVRFLMLGGETINFNDVKKLKKKCENITVMNHYGPTETTIGSVATLISNQDLRENNHKCSIGKPIHNTQCYILDRNKRLSPIGGKGELCIGGEGVGLGYLNNQILTDIKFIQNPIEHSSLIYCTGDLARWQPNGTIDFLGRIDNQVKIRGFRIELGEIENQLSLFEKIKEAVVIVDENKNLVAYYVSEEKIEVSILRDYLKSKLTEYMVPSFYVYLKELPLTTNGKINRKALPSFKPTKEEGYLPARNNTEETLVEIWSDILQLDKNIISIDKSFFELGGDSIKIVLLNSIINKRLNWKLPISDLFKYTTISSLTKFMEDNVMFSKDLKEEADGEVMHMQGALNILNKN